MTSIRYDATGCMMNPRDEEEEHAFQVGLKHVLGREGRYSDYANDPGGETNFGISSVYNYGVNVKKITKEDAEKIYRAKYWEGTRVNKLDSRIAPAAFDLAVNPGTFSGVRIVQRALGVKDDGAIGPITIEASKNADIDAVFDKMVKYRKEYYDEKAKKNKFIRDNLDGLYNRSDDMMFLKPRKKRTSIFD